MREVQKFAAESEPRRGDNVAGWFGTGVITDISYGFVTDSATNEPMDDPSGRPDDLIRINQNGRSRYIYRADIERNYTVENSILRA